ncbi:MAG: hypothetical protein GF372_01395 [Candidatus Marinimicrobia bacterium]|nr:hypothetical protein [Candidatus Neomarinimicrobiota bacterium]
MQKNNKTNKNIFWIVLFSMLVPTVVFGLLVVGMQSDYTTQVKNLVDKKKELEQKIDSLNTHLGTMESNVKSVSNVRLSKIVATAYNSFPWQTNSEPLITSSGESVKDGTLALSRDLIRPENNLMHRMGFNPAGAYSYGDTVFVIYVKPMVVHDTMNRRYRDRADIWLPGTQEDYNTARLWGRREVFIARFSDS